MQKQIGRNNKGLRRLDIPRGDPSRGKAEPILGTIAA